MSMALAQMVRQKREQELQKEKLLLIAKKVKNLADEAFDLKEQATGARLLDVVDFIRALLKVREP